jgi:hypothetical protein
VRAVLFAPYLQWLSFALDARANEAGPESAKREVNHKQHFNVRHIPSSEETERSVVARDTPAARAPPPPQGRRQHRN